MHVIKVKDYKSEAPTIGKTRRGRVSLSPVVATRCRVEDCLAESREVPTRISRLEREQTSYAGAPLRDRLKNLPWEGKQMAAIARLTGAPSVSGNNWKAINWQKVRREVRRLQIRIAKAIRDGRYGRVKALQWLLTRSFSGKALAVKRVVSNRGRKTPGVDGAICVPIFLYSTHNNG